MKRTTYNLFIALIVLVFYACESTEVQKSGEVDEQRLESFKNLTVPEKRLVYNSLTAPEKYVFWHWVIDEKAKLISLTSAQKQLLKELKSGVKLEAFVNENGKAEALDFSNRWYTKAKPSFVGVDLNKLLTPDAPKTNAVASTAKTQLSGEETDCDCELNGFFTCGGCIAPPHPGCNSTSSGCGFLWLAGCNGLCD